MLIRYWSLDVLASGRCCKNMITFLKPSHLKTSSNNNIICLNFDWITKYFFLRHSNCVERKGKEILVVISSIFFCVYLSFFFFLRLILFREVIKTSRRVSTKTSHYLPSSCTASFCDKRLE